MNWHASSNCHAKFSHLKWSNSNVSTILSADKKIFTVSILHDSQNDRPYVPAMHRLLQENAFANDQLLVSH